ncbi:MAG: ABC transporter ATP-binding protein [Thermodesulfobacteriota bacterium]|nr:ABC transporter ATP-binding protein [Thermodesulfobacteriota bacterium]
MTQIVAENIEKIYGTGDSRFTAVSDMSFAVAPGEFVAVMGESGAGKSTLLSILGALNAPTSGRYRVDGIDVYGLSREKQADFRREFLGFVFQHFHLMPYLSVLENVMLPLTTSPLKRHEKKALAARALETVGLMKKAGHLPFEISGGEKERTAVARAIVNEPPIILADEPTGNLDTRNTGDVMALLRRLSKQGTTIIMVTHSRTCSAFADRIMTIADGRIWAGNEDHIIPEMEPTPEITCPA